MNKAITTVADNLKSHPVAFALIVVVLLFLTAELWILRDVAANTRERFNAQDRLLAQMAKDCFDVGSKR